MPKVEFSPTDILAGKLVDPDWYLIKITSAGEAPAKDGNSTNYPMEATIVSNLGGDVTFAGVPLRWNFNSKAPGFQIGFLESLGVEITPGKRYELADTVGMTVGAFVDHSEYNGRVRNNVGGKYRKV